MVTTIYTLEISRKPSKRRLLGADDAQAEQEAPHPQLVHELDKSNGLKSSARPLLFAAQGRLGHVFSGLMGGQPLRELQRQELALPVHHLLVDGAEVVEVQ